MKGFWGKYRGVVEKNQGQGSGKILVKVKDVWGEKGHGWAMPCVPYAGKEVGFLALPPVGANVWVEFESGDSERPIWTGCFWDEKEKLPGGGEAKTKILKTEQATVLIDDEAKKLTLKVGDKVQIVLDSSSIEITNGQSRIKLSGREVSVNDGALSVE